MLGISVHGHIIAGKDGHESLTRMKLLICAASRQPLRPPAPNSGTCSSTADATVEAISDIRPMVLPIS
jgi:hypothetical protein